MGHLGDTQELDYGELEASPATGTVDDKKCSL
jgi:hypothetical protein